MTSEKKITDQALAMLNKQVKELATYEAEAEFEAQAKQAEMAALRDSLLYMEGKAAHQESKLSQAQQAQELAEAEAEEAKDKCSIATKENAALKEELLQWKDDRPLVMDREVATPLLELLEYAATLLPPVELSHLKLALRAAVSSSQSDVPILWLLKTALAGSQQLQSAESATEHKPQENVAGEDRSRAVNLELSKELSRALLESAAVTVPDGSLSAEEAWKHVRMLERRQEAHLSKAARQSGRSSLPAHYPLTVCYRIEDLSRQLEREKSLVLGMREQAEQCSATYNDEVEHLKAQVTKLKKQCTDLEKESERQQQLDAIVPSSSKKQMGVDALLEAAERAAAAAAAAEPRLKDLEAEVEVVKGREAWLAQQLVEKESLLESMRESKEHLSRAHKDAENQRLIEGFGRELFTQHKKELQRALAQAEEDREKSREAGRRCEATVCV